MLSDRCFPFDCQTVVPAPPIPTGYYVRASAAAPALLAPTPANYPNATTRINDVGLNDHTTFESQNIGGIGTQGSIEILLSFGSFGARQSYTAALYYGSGAMKAVYYWDGAAWQAWDNTALPTHGLGDAWEDISVNPADQSTLYLLLVVNEISDGITTNQIRVGDWRVT